MSRYHDLKGMEFGRLKVIERSGTYAAPDSITTQPIWLCQCSCGNKTYVVTRNLLSGATKSCGCLRKEWCKKLGASQKKKGSKKNVQ